MKYVGFFYPFPPNLHNRGGECDVETTRSSPLIGKKVYTAFCSFYFTKIRSKVVLHHNFSQDWECVNQAQTNKITNTAADTLLWVQYPVCMRSAVGQSTCFKIHSAEYDGKQQFCPQGAFMIGMAVKGGLFCHQCRLLSSVVHWHREMR